MNINLLLVKAYNAFLKRIYKKQKTYQDWLNKGYINTPLVSFILQSHNKSIQVLHVISKLRAVPNAEIIVIDDGSKPIHSRRLFHFLDRGNEFILRSNDLYENVMYDKALRFANGKYCVLMQDDDDFDTLNWIDDGIALLKKYPNMVILGGCGGYTICFDNKEKIGIVHHDEQSTNFKFVDVVDRAPMWINKDLFIEKLHHIDYSFAPFMYDDQELCLRAWLNGLSVGWYNSPFKSLSAGGMRIWNSLLANEQTVKNSKKIYQMYALEKDQICSLVGKANRDIL